jgi:hypothetical protein
MANSSVDFMSGDSDYQEQFSLWQEVRAAIAGKYKVVQQVTCLPNPQYKQYPVYSGMSDAQINQANACNQANALRVQSYWSRGRFFNATGRTHEALGGMVWSNEPEVELAPRLEYLEFNADGSGSGLREVAQEVIDEVDSIGRYGVLVDMPSNEARLTQSQMQMQDHAPRFIRYSAEQIIYTRVAGESTSIDEIRLKETKSVQKNEWDWEDVTQLRRLIMIDGEYHNQLWSDKKELISDFVPIADGKPFTEIPFQFFGADNNSPEYSKIPLYDLANANLGHFVLDCDNRDNLHFHGQGMTNVFTEMTAEEFGEANPNGLDVGAKGRNLFNQGDSVELLQLDATGAIPAEMLRDEQRMIMLGAQLVTDASNNQTLGAKEIEVNSSTSTLKRIVYNVSAGLEQCLQWAALFLGESTESIYKINTDFVIDNMTPEMITKHIELVQGGVLPKATLYETSRKVGFTKLDNEELAAEAEKDSAEIQGMSQAEAQTQAASEAE